jgi:Putative prokaryotic signal transducing protein
MNTDPHNLAKHFRDMSDDELLYRCSSGSLTEVAQSIAIEELTSRGLKLPDPIITAGGTARYDGVFETVARFLIPTDAHIMCACLEAAGVPALVADANLVQMNNLWAIALGGVRVLVPASRVAEAKDVIAAFNRGDFALPNDFDNYHE